MSIRDELLKFKNSTKNKKQSLQEQSVFSNLPGVEPDKKDYRRPIPDPVMLPDCFTALMKSDINMVSYNKNTLQKAPSDQLGLTLIKDGKPFCFVKK